jgi:hypothetical protein
MMNKQGCFFIVLIASVSFVSCTVSKTYPKEYYAQHRATMHEMETQYDKITKQKLIAVAFYDLDYNDLSIEIKTDTVRYIYDFKYGEKRIGDSLLKFGYDTTLTLQLIKNMRSIGCSWINTLDYYTDGNKKLLLFMSAPVKQFSLIPAFQKRKYYLFHFYEQPQYYDEQGRLLEKRKLRQLRKISSEVFWRINDKVCYTVSGKFR